MKKTTKKRRFVEPFSTLGHGTQPPNRNAVSTHFRSRIVHSFLLSIYYTQRRHTRRYKTVQDNVIKRHRHRHRMERINTKGMRRRKKKKYAAFNKNNMYGHGYTIRCDTLAPKTGCHCIWKKKDYDWGWRGVSFSRLCSQTCTVWHGAATWPGRDWRGAHQAVSVNVDNQTFAPIECSRKSSLFFVGWIKSVVRID